MRVFRPRTGQGETRVEEEEAHSGAGDREAARGRRGAVGGRFDRGCLQEARGVGADVPPLEGDVRRDEGPGDEAPERARARERAAEEAGGGPVPRHRDAEGARQGKLLTPTRRRWGARHVQETFGVSQRRACRVTGQHRATQRYERSMVSDEAKLVNEMRRLAARHPRFGSPRILQLLIAEGWRVNHKRVERLWRREGLKVPQRQRKRRRLGHSANSCSRRRAERMNEVWTYDLDRKSVV